MIISAMIFAGLTLVIGGALGFLLGQARVRMIYEEKLRNAEADRASLETQLTNMKEYLRAAGLGQLPQSGQASSDKGRE
jgi:membrane protein YqaA with SNARE-associated domain